jgi:hypothetical protein
MNETGSWVGWRLGHGWVRWRLALVDDGFGGSPLRLGLGYEGIPFSRVYVLDLIIRVRVEWP